MVSSLSKDLFWSSLRGSVGMKKEEAVVELLEWWPMKKSHWMLWKTYPQKPIHRNLSTAFVSTFLCWANWLEKFWTRGKGLILLSGTSKSQDRSQRQREFEIELLRKDALYYPIFGERKNLSHSIQILTSEPFILNPDLSSLCLLPLICLVCVLTIKNHHCNQV